MVKGNLFFGQNSGVRGQNVFGGEPTKPIVKTYTKPQMSFKKLRLQSQKQAQACYPKPADAATRAAAERRSAADRQASADRRAAADRRAVVANAVVAMTATNAAVATLAVTTIGIITTTNAAMVTLAIHTLAH